MRPAVVALILGLLAASAMAPATRGAEPEAPKPPPAIQLEAVALPIVVDGRLINYVFCSIRLELNPQADGAAVRAKEQFFRDDLVRAGHRTPFIRLDDYNKIDEAKVRAEVFRAAPGIVGPGVVKSVVITKQASMKTLTRPGVQKPHAREIVP
jgi:hypothetical protein